MNAEILLEAQQLFCERDDRVLFRDLSFALHAGEVIQVRGSNGSGKTTLLRLLCGLNQAYSGSIRWRGQELREHSEDYFAELLYIGHRNGVNKVLTPLENLRWSCGLHQAAPEQVIEEALATLGLRGFEYSQCYTLSAGQQQRVSLTRLLLSKARLWILDEPFTTLDTHAVQQIEQIISRHAAAGGGVLVTTHHNLNIPGLRAINLE